MTTESEFQAFTAKAITNMGRLDQIVNGSATTTVTTDSGPVKSIAKLEADLTQLTIDGLAGATVSSILGLSSALDAKADLSIAPANVLSYGADSTGAADSTSAFSLGGTSSRAIRIAAGTYKLNSNPSAGVAATWIVEPGATFTGTGKLQSPTSHVISYGGAYRGFASDTSIYTGIYGYLEQNSGLAVTAELAITGQTQSLGNGTTSGTYNIGLSALGLHNNVGSSGHVIGVYSTVARWAGVIGATQGMEIDVANMGSTVQMHPANMFPAGQTVGAWIASGGELAMNGVGSPGVASVALGILQNDNQTTKTASFDKGIIFHNKAIYGADGTGSIGCAIAYAVGHAQQWYNNSNQVIGEIVATGTTQANNNFRLDFSNYGLLVQDRSSGQAAFGIAQRSGFTSAIIVTPGDATNAPTLSTNGSGLLHMRLQPSGTSQVVIPVGNVPNYTNDTAAGAGGVPLGGLYRNGSVMMLRAA